MATAPERPALRERFERRRAEVIERAASVFAERGYDGAAIEDLSEATGLAAGGLYHYIGSKEQLLSEIFDQLMDPLLEVAQRIAADEGAARDRLRELIGVWVAHVAAHRDHMLVFSQERHVLERDPARWRAIRRSRREFERILGELIDQCAAEARGAGAGGAGGADNPPGAATAGGVPDLRIVQFGLLGMVNYTPQWLRPSGRLDAEQIAAGYWFVVDAALHGHRY